jgi:hypothetical protein
LKRLILFITPAPEEVITSFQAFILYSLRFYSRLKERISTAYYKNVNHQNPLVLAIPVKVSRSGYMLRAIMIRFNDGVISLSKNQRLYPCLQRVAPHRGDAGLPNPGPLP